MVSQIQVPSMGESITEVVIGQILVPSGQQVKEDQEILEIETDKLNQVLFSPSKGVLNLTVSQGQTVNVGDIIGSIDESASSTTLQESADSKISDIKPEPEKATISSESEAQSINAPNNQASIDRKSINDFVSSINNESLDQTLPKQEAPIKNGVNKNISQELGAFLPKEETRQKMTKIRQVIAEKLVEAQQSAAMLTTFNEVDLSEVMAIRKSYKDDFIKEYDVKLGFMSFFVKAVVYALKKVPAINAYIDGDDLVQRHYYDISIAVGTDRGLVVPVIRGCDQMSFAQIEQSIGDVAKKARTGRLTIDDLQGGGFTITNGGVYGSLVSTPILNSPQCGILGMHKIQKRPVVVNDEIVIRPMMYLALSYDHRIVDGKEAVTFLVNVKECLEDPHRLLIGI